MATRERRLEDGKIHVFDGDTDKGTDYTGSIAEDSCFPAKES